MDTQETQINFDFPKAVKEIDAIPQENTFGDDTQYYAILRLKLDPMKLSREVGDSNEDALTAYAASIGEHITKKLRPALAGDFRSLATKGGKWDVHTRMDGDGTTGVVELMLKSQGHASSNYCHEVVDQVANLLQQELKAQKHPKRHFVSPGAL